MDNWFVNLLKTIWSFFVGSLRIILFLCCLIYLLIQLGALAIYSQADKTDASVFAPERLTRSNYQLLEFIALILITSLGCYGSFYKHRLCLKVFTILITLYSCYSLIGLILFTPKEMDLLNDELQKQMSEYSKTYVWDSSSLLKGKPNKFWDTLQVLGCCGLKGPKDWDKERPHGISSSTYPRTCCPLNYHQTCTKNDDLYETGCNDLIRDFEKFTILSVCGVIVFQVILGIFAFIVAYLSLGQPSAPGSRSPNMLETGNTNLGHGYQRFSGSVYVRQPPTNESFEPKAPTLYPSVPTAHDLEKEYSAAPPVYGSVMK